MFKYLLQKEFLQIKRNSFLPKLIFIFPFMIMTVMPWVMNMEVSNIVVDIVDNDHSTKSRELTQTFSASQYFILNDVKETYADASADIDRNDADMIVVIPQNYGRNIETGQKTNVLIAANSVNGTKGTMGASYASQLITGAYKMNGVNIHYLYNKSLNYKKYMVPALMALLILMLCGFLPALNIVGEKEAGTIEQINVTPVNKWLFILSKLTPYWIIACIVTIICLFLSWLYYGITCQGSFAAFALLSIIMAIFFSSFGLVVSNISNTMQQAIFVMWFFVVLMMLLGGLMTPLRSMPELVQTINHINPMTYYAAALRTLFIRGGDFSSVAPQLLILSLFALAMATCAVKSYKKNS